MTDLLRLENLAVHFPLRGGLLDALLRRGRGVGSALLAACEREAAALEVETLYLYTHSAEDFYRRYGWSVVARDVYGGETVAIMSKTLQDSRGVRAIQTQPPSR